MYAKTDIVPEGLQKTIATLQAEMKELEASPYWRPPKPKEQIEAEYKAAYTAARDKEEKTRKRYDELKLQIGRLRDDLMNLRSRIAERASLMQIEPAYDTRQCLELEKRIRELDAELQTIPTMTEPMPIKEDVRAYTRQHKNIQSQYETLRCRWRHATHLAEQEQWRPAYIAYADNAGLQYDEKDPDEIFDVCHKYHQEFLLVHHEFRCPCYADPDPEDPYEVEHTFMYRDSRCTRGTKMSVQWDLDDCELGFINATIPVGYVERR